MLATSFWQQSGGAEEVGQTEGSPCNCDCTAIIQRKRDEGFKEYQGRDRLKSH